MFESNADKTRPARTILGHGGSHIQIAEGAQNVPLADAALHPNFILLLTNHGGSPRTTILAKPGRMQKITEGTFSEALGNRATMATGNSTSTAIRPWPLALSPWPKATSKIDPRQPSQPG